jgi:MFS family permease
MVKQKTNLSVGRWRSYVILFSENRQFRRLWLAGVISHLGNWFNYIAIFVLLTELTGSGQAVSWFLIAKFIPTSFLGPAAGVIADRLPRKTIMIASDLCRAGVVLCFLLIRRPDQVWIVYFLALLQESMWTFSDPARRASIPNLCRPEELNLANALGGATWSVLLAVGAALGGFITSLFGWQTAIALDSLTFIISAAMLTKLTLPPPPRAPEKESGDSQTAKKRTWKEYTGLNDLKAGSKYVTAHPKVAVLLLVKSGWALSGGILVMLTVFGEQVYSSHGQGSGSGILYSFRGVGAALGPILAWRFLGETRHAMYRSIGISFFFASGAYLLFSRAPGLISAAPLVLLGHLGGSVQWVFSTTLLQQTVPDLFRGRVFATEMALVTFVLSISTYVTGAALDAGADPRHVVRMLALLFLLPGTLWTLYIWTRGKGND